MTVRNDRPQGLGRGLAALIPQRAPPTTGSIEIPLARIRANPYQPRQRIDDEALERSPRASASTACSSRSS